MCDGRRFQADGAATEKKLFESWFNARSGRVIQPIITNSHALRLSSRTGKRVRRCPLCNLRPLVIFKGIGN